MNNFITHTDTDTDMDTDMDTEFTDTDLQQQINDLNCKINTLILIQTETNKKLFKHISFIETLYEQIKKPFHFIMSIPSKYTNYFLE